MPIKKSELYSSLWQSCDELRGGMDASQYKDYVLVLLFVKYVSDKAASQKGYLLDVPPGGSFADMVALQGDKEIGDKMNKIISKLAEANELKGVIDVADFNDADKLGRGKEMVDRLSNLVAIFDSPQSGLRCQPCRGGRPAWRRIRVLNAPLRDRIGKEQRTVLHACRSLACDG
jgi:type I restriction enzyme M protein